MTPGLASLMMDMQALVLGLTQAGEEFAFCVIDVVGAIDRNQVVQLVLMIRKN